MAAPTADRLEESLWGVLKHDFEERAHPRGRGGKWIDKVGGEVADEAKKVGRKLERQPIQRRERDITSTEAFRRGLRRISYMRETGHHGDEFMYDLATDEGFAGRPQVVSEAELRQHIADGDLEMFRGVSDESYAQAFTSGTAILRVRASEATGSTRPRAPGRTRWPSPTRRRRRHAARW
jgi:hypothetical protein